MYFLFQMVTQVPNMTMTIMSAAKEVSAIANPTMENLAKAISGGSLRGAREIQVLFYRSC